MKFSIFVDYANLYNSAAKIINADLYKNKGQIENCIIDILKKIKSYVEEYYQYKNVEVVSIRTYVLPDKQFDIAASKLREVGADKVKVECELKKSDVLKDLNGSRLDDRYLKLDVLSDIEKKDIEGIVIVSNDSDFIEVCNMVTSEGKYSWIAYYEDSSVPVKRELKESADIALPIAELLFDKKATNNVKNDDDLKKEVKGRRVEFYRNNEFIFAYPLKRQSFSIGRRSVRRNHIPNIDFADIDKEKIVSRQHADIHILNNNKMIFCVNEKCTRGTWYNKKAKRPNEQFTVEEGHPVLLGQRDGFVMYYYSK